MKIIFIGRDNSFNRKYVNGLSEAHEIICCLFVEPGRNSIQERVAKIKSRIKRYGLLQVINELAFHVFDRCLLRRNEKKLHLKNSDYFINGIEVKCPAFNVENIHSNYWLNYINLQRPDIILNICCSVIFQPKLYNLPKFGTFTIHEGITPEYKGLHSSLWALMNKDFEYIGFTVLKIDEKIDGGDVLLQKRYNLQSGENHKTWSWISHNSLIEGLQTISNALKKLEHDNGFTPLNVENRTVNYYTWMTMTMFIHLYIKNKFRFKHLVQHGRSNSLPRTVVRMDNDSF